MSMTNRAICQRRPVGSQDDEPLGAVLAGGGEPLGIEFGAAPHAAMLHDAEALGTPVPGILAVQRGAESWGPGVAEVPAGRGRSRP